MSTGGKAPAAPGNPQGISKVQEVQLQVQEASDVMRDNVSQMLSNYEKAEVLEDKAGTRCCAVCGRDGLHVCAAAFRTPRPASGWLRYSFWRAFDFAALLRRAPRCSAFLRAHASPDWLAAPDSSRAASLTVESKKFYKRSNQVKQNMCMKNAKMWALIACIIIVIIIIIVVPVVMNGIAAAKALEKGKEAVNSTEEE